MLVIIKRLGKNNTRILVCHASSSLDDEAVQVSRLALTKHVHLHPIMLSLVCDVYAKLQSSLSKGQVFIHRYALFRSVDLLKTFLQCLLERR
jgi:hypothetical protein